MSNRLNLAVVGCGYWGPNLARNFDSLPTCRLGAICDSSRERLGKALVRHPAARPLASFDELLSDGDLEAVAIATPVRTHYELARRALERGLHVFIEKPMTSSTAEAEELVALADKKGLVLMVGHVFVYSPAVRKIKKLMADGELGKVFYISSQRLNLGIHQQDINVAWDLAPHDISIILYLLDQLPEHVNCSGQAHLASGIEDVTVMTLKFADGPFASIQSSWLDPNKVRRTTIVGSRKMIVYDDIEPLEKIRIYDKRVEAPRQYDSFGSFPFAYHYGDMLAPHIEQDEPLRVECQRFVDCVRNGERSESGGREGLAVVRVLEAANESLRDGGHAIRLQAG
ncbi:MAG TPA: Gfo/Idh/MocA family oxidoreductase [Planctomycetota bacterium]|nr:Gfo/Idh/MocA family oxidoreductase [Planctomycetota bacterium]